MRKTPKQKRSREMVSTLVEATARVVQKDGLDNLTTGRVAEAAGVSVGSLYQYFRDKDALIDAMLKSLADEIGHNLARLPLAKEADLRFLVGSAIRFGFAVLHSRDGLYLELVRNWHRLSTDTMVNVLQHHFMELSRRYFLQHYRDYPIDNVYLRVFIITNSVLFTMVRHISQQDPFVDEETLTQELTHMVTQYIESPAIGGGHAT